MNLIRQAQKNSPDSPIGIFDSGVGGLSVLRAISTELPDEELIYFADQANVPYGSKSLEEVRHFSEEITRFLLDHNVKIIVIACNTASAAALHWLRRMFPDTSFVGMEPAVKPAAEGTQTGCVGVLATQATFQGALYASVIERFAQGVKVYQDTCPGLVQQIEDGELTSPETHRILNDALRPMLAGNVDRIVLGCTHYPFVIPVIEKITGPEVRVIDPSPAIAGQVRRVLAKDHLFRENQSIQTNPGPLCQMPVRVLTTGDPLKMEKMLSKLLGCYYPVEAITA